MNWFTGFSCFLGERKEFFREIPGYKGYYISSVGDVVSGRRKLMKIRKLDLAENGYYRIALCIDGKISKHPVHRLVAIVWIGAAPKGKPQINHKNGIKTDNDYNNLEWCSHMENQIHWDRVLGKKRVGSELHWTKLTEAQVMKIRKKYKNSSSRKLAKEYDVNKSTILRIVKNKIWSHLCKN